MTPVRKYRRSWWDRHGRSLRNHDSGRRAAVVLHLFAPLNAKPNVQRSAARHRLSGCTAGARPLLFSGDAGGWQSGFNSILRAAFCKSTRDTRARQWDNAPAFCCGAQFHYPAGDGTAVLLLFRITQHAHTLPRKFRFLSGLCITLPQLFTSVCSSKKVLLARIWRCQ